MLSSQVPREQSPNSACFKVGFRKARNRCKRGCRDAFLSSGLVRPLRKEHFQKYKEAVLPTALLHCHRLVMFPQHTYNHLAGSFHNTNISCYPLQLVRSSHCSKRRERPQLPQIEFPQQLPNTTELKYFC